MKFTFFSLTLQICLDIIIGGIRSLGRGIRGVFLKTYQFHTLEANLLIFDKNSDSPTALLPNFVYTQYSLFSLYLLEIPQTPPKITIFIFTFLCSPNDLHLNLTFFHIIRTFSSLIYFLTHAPTRIYFNIKIEMRFIAMADDGNGRCIT